jgi:4-hydroxybenzoate polyprenyltransferase
MLAFLQLLRLPTVFTAMADIVLGFVLTHRFLYGPFKPVADQLEPQIGWHEPGQFVGLLISSCCLYLAGMVFNDVFDRKQDAAERPGRPIPSGRVSVKAATILGTVLMLAGLVSASTVCRVSLEVASLLVIAILGYDAILKKTMIGPFAMGSCRFLNVMLGASVQPDLVPSLFSQPQLAAATGLGIYIVGVTLFARTEATTSSSWHLRFAQLVINLGFAILIALVLMTFIRSPKEVSVAMLLVIAFSVNRRAGEAIHDPSPAKVQAGIKVMLLSLVFMDAALIFSFLNTPESASYGAYHALATACLVIPAMFLSRMIPMT